MQGGGFPGRPRSVIDYLSDMSAELVGGGESRVMPPICLWVGRFVF